MLPPTEKTPLPKPKTGGWHYRKRYFDVGDAITWAHWGGRVMTGTVTKIKTNRMGRVSYYAGNEFILIEDVQRAMEQL